MVQIPISLKFGSNDPRARFNNTEHTNIRRVGYKDEKEKGARKEMEQVRCFISQIRWSTSEEEREKGGITWIELYALFL